MADNTQSNAAQQIIGSKLLDKQDSISSKLLEREENKSRRIGALRPYGFKKGQSGNPEGSRLHNPELRAIKRLTNDELIDVCSFMIKGNLDELKTMLDNPKETVLRLMLASVAYKTIVSGDIKGLELFLDRIIGKVKEKTEVTVNPDLQNAAQITEELYLAAKSCK